MVDPGPRQREDRAHRGLHRATVERVGAARGEERRVPSQRRDAPQDQPEVRRVDQVLTHDDPVGVRRSSSTDARSRRANDASAPRWTSNPVVAQEHVLVDHVDGCRHIARTARRCRSVPRTARSTYPASSARRIVAVPSARNRPCSASNELAQHGVAQMEEVAQPRIVGIVDRFGRSRRLRGGRGTPPELVDELLGRRLHAQAVVVARAVAVARAGADEVEPCRRAPRSARAARRRGRGDRPRGPPCRPRPSARSARRAPTPLPFHIPGCASTQTPPASRISASASIGIQRVLRDVGGAVVGDVLVEGLLLGRRRCPPRPSPAPRAAGRSGRRPRSHGPARTRCRSRAPGASRPSSRRVGTGCR